MAANVRTMTHRLYLSALVVLLVFGLAGLIGAVVSLIHDLRVTAEDRLCFEQALSASPPTDDLDSAASLRKRRAQVACHLVFENAPENPRGRSLRAWFRPPAQAALLLLAWLPALILWAMTTWLRWLLKSDAS